MISQNKLSACVLGVLLMSAMLVNSELVSVLIYLFLAVFIVTNEDLYVDLFHRKLIYIIIVIVLIASINLFFNFRVVNYPIGYRDILRDIWYFSRPAFLLLIGYNFGKKTVPEDLLKVIFTVGILSAGYHYVQIIQFGSLDILTGKRLYLLWASSFVEALLLGILIIKFFKRDSLNFKSRFLNNQTTLILITAFITPSFILYMSRSMIVVLLALLFFGLELYKFNFKSISIGVFALISIVYISVIENTDSRFIEKIQRSTSEIGISATNYQSRLDENTINAVWRGYEAYRAVSQILNNNKLVWLWGEGLGAHVDLKIQKVLANNEYRFIPRIHNGYIMIFFKAGTIGLLLYLYLMYKMVFGIKRRTNLPIANKDFVIKIVQGIGLSILLTSVVIAGIYNTGDMTSMIILYSAILGSLSYDGPYEAKLQDKANEMLIVD